MMQIRLNGDRRDISDGATVADLVTELGLRPEQVAVELNRKLVARSSRSNVALQPGDELEFVTLVGGG
ncbi:MAG: thiamine biosynthesis protein ThiS [Candidatus Paceibacteria bacterium]|jgi:thiamine biosynthesis protein ThiS